MPWVSSWISGVESEPRSARRRQEKNMSPSLNHIKPTSQPASHGKPNYLTRSFSLKFFYKSYDYLTRSFSLKLFYTSYDNIIIHSHISPSILPISTFFLIRTNHITTIPIHPSATRAFTITTRGRKEEEEE